MEINDDLRKDILSYRFDSVTEKAALYLGFENKNELEKLIKEHTDIDISIIKVPIHYDSIEDEDFEYFSNLDTAKKVFNCPILSLPEIVNVVDFIINQFPVDHTEAYNILFDLENLN